MKIAIICLVVFALLSGVCYDIDFVGLSFSFGILSWLSSGVTLQLYLQGHKS